MFGRAHPVDLRIALSATAINIHIGPVNFDSLDDLLKVFKAALPAIDVSSLLRVRGLASSILFADVVELTEVQRSILGLEE